MDLREELPGDTEAVRVVHRRAFGDDGWVAELVDGLRESTASPLSLVAAVDGVFKLPAYEPWMTGTLVYAEAFWRHDAVGLRDGQ